MSTLQAAIATLLLGLLLGLGIGYWHYSPRIEAAEGRVRTLADRLAEQNDAIERLQGLARERELQAAAALEAARSVRAESDRRAAELLALLPPPGADECQAAADLIRRELGR